MCHPASARTARSTMAATCFETFAEVFVHPVALGLIRSWLELAESAGSHSNMRSSFMCQPGPANAGQIRDGRASPILPDLRYSPSFRRTLVVSTCSGMALTRVLRHL